MLYFQTCTQATKKIKISIKNDLYLYLDISKISQTRSKGNAGKMENVEIIYGQIRSGSALMFYPEVNAIFGAPIDERCGTPAFKRVPIAIF